MAVTRGAEGSIELDLKEPPGLPHPRVEELEVAAKIASIKVEEGGGRGAELSVLAVSCGGGSCLPGSCG